MKCRFGCEHAAVQTNEGPLCMEHWAKREGNLVFEKALDKDQWAAHLRQVEADNAARAAIKGRR